VILLSRAAHGSIPRQAINFISSGLAAGLYILLANPLPGCTLGLGNIAASACRRNYTSPSSVCKNIREMSRVFYLFRILSEQSMCVLRDKLRSLSRFLPHSASCECRRYCAQSAVCRSYKPGSAQEILIVPWAFLLLWKSRRLIILQHVDTQSLCTFWKDEALQNSC